MADILIKGIQFPKFSPHVIEVYPDGTAIAHGKGIYGKAVPVPPHGRLIDADVLEKNFCSHCDDYMSGKDECKEGCFDLKIIKSMPTVISADKDGESR